MGRIKHNPRAVIKCLRKNFYFNYRFLLKQIIWKSLFSKQQFNACSNVNFLIRCLVGLFVFSVTVERFYFEGGFVDDTKAYNIILFTSNFNSILLNTKIFKKLSLQFQSRNKTFFGSFIKSTLIVQSQHHIFLSSILSRFESPHTKASTTVKRHIIKTQCRFSASNLRT